MNLVSKHYACNYRDVYFVSGEIVKPAKSKWNRCVERHLVRKHREIALDGSVR